MKSLSSNRIRSFTVAVVIAASVAGLAGCSYPNPAEVDELIARCEKHGLDARAFRIDAPFGGIVVECFKQVGNGYVEWDAENLQP